MREMLMDIRAVLVASRSRLHPAFQKGSRADIDDCIRRIDEQVRRPQGPDGQEAIE